MRLIEWIAAGMMAALAIYFAVSLWQGFNNPYSFHLGS